MDIQPMQPSQPSQAEPVPVQLTRMEGTINLIAYQFSEVKDDIKELRAESKGHGVDIEALKIAQAAQSGAATSWRTWLPVVLTAASIAVAIIAVYVSR